MGVMTDAAALAATYFDAWKARDFDRLRGLQGLAQITTGIDVRKVFLADSDVLTWYDLATSVADPVPVANWMHVEDGKITRIRAAFDARGLAGGS
jgi:hypothetical protein